MCAAQMIRACLISLGVLACAATFGCEAYLVDGLGTDVGGQSGVDGPPLVIDSCASFYERFEPTADVSFQDDLVPILQKNCNGSSCHGGDYERAQAGLWLGPGEDATPTAEDLWFVYRSLIDIQSTVAPGLALVRGGNAAESYFMRKLDDCHDPEGLECALDPKLYGAPCGVMMPVLSTALSAEERGLFRSWIQNGAVEN